MAKKKSSKSRKSGRSRSGGNGSAKQAAGKQLVIVESPAKARTINRYLGDDYVVMASVGHIRDLPKRNPKGVKAPVPGVDVEHDFEPTYEIIHGKGTTVTELKRAAKTADGVWLATDLDREGEAIAWHLAEALDVNLDQAKRVVFNAITSDEIRRAFERPREIDLDKVSAQQARRILDRIVGYQVSPLLWKKVAGGLSAGRVQSVAVRLIVEREREIRDFVPDEYWRILGSFTLDTEKVDDLAAQWRQWLADQAEEAKKHKTQPRGQNGVSMRARNGWLAEHQSLSAELIEVGGEKFSADNADRALEVAQMAGFVLDDREDREDPDAKGPAKNKVTLTGHVDGGPDWRVQNIETKRTRSRPNAPFITSTMQQAASNAMNFSASRTMRTAQQLYEGIEVGNLGSVGLITYMRTDSTHISGEALNAARKFITQKYGEKYLPEKPNFFGSTNKQAQEAHEAIRPTDVTLSPDDSRLKAALSKEQLALYSLIWKRFVGSQMIPAEWDATTLRIAGEADGTEIVFKATGRVLVEKGFYLVTGVPNTADDPVLPQVEQDQPVAALEIDPQQMFTNPPPRYSEASLVKKLEAEGIGRPSTYAQIIQVIQNRKYVEKISGRFHATDLGEVVTDKLIEGFPGIMDVGYTRWMEDELDAVEEQHRDWVQFLHSFYKTFQDNLAQAHEEMSHAKAETEPSEYECPTCGAACVYRFGRNGKFLSCSRYPDCKYAAPIDRQGRPHSPEETDIACPECGKPMLHRKGRYGPFLSCSDYPDCKGIVNLDKQGAVKPPSPPPLETDLECPKCEAPLYLRSGKRGPWLSCSTFPKCRGRLGWTKLDEETQKKWELALKNHEKENPQPTIKTTDGQPVGENYKPQVAGGEDDQSDDGDVADDGYDSNAA